MTVETTRRSEEFVRALTNLNPGDRAVLKRNAGRNLSEARNVTGLFYRMLPFAVTSNNQQEMYFLLATLYPLVKKTARTGNLGDSLRHIRTTGNEAALNRRVNVLLDADTGQLPFRLRQLLRLIESQQGSVNWTQLLDDLLKWERQNRPTQRKWAMSYYGQQPPPDEDAGEKEAEPDID